MIEKDENHLSTEAYANTVAVLNDIDAADNEMLKRAVHTLAAAFYTDARILEFGTGTLVTALHAPSSSLYPALSIERRDCTGFEVGDALPEETERESLPRDWVHLKFKTKRSLRSFIRRLEELYDDLEEDGQT